MSLAGVAKQTVEISQQGRYLAPSGRTVDIQEAVQRSLDGVRLYTPEVLDALLDAPPEGTGDAPTFEVTDERTQEAAHRLAANVEVLLLNFASAKNPGGGFLRGAKAQEEDVARSSALYLTQLRARGYYDANRACGTMVYTDHMIYSPRVPFFRQGRALLERPFLASVITAPAPNAGEARRKGGQDKRLVEPTLRRRAGKVLALAEAEGHRTLLLGAWGCGVFRNDPAMVAEVFSTWLKGPRFWGAFDKVIFAVPKGPNHGAFAARFLPGDA